MSETEKPAPPESRLSSLLLYPSKSPFLRLFSLWYFCFLMTAWNILGHTVLGFEQSWLQYLTALGTAVFMQYFLEIVDAHWNERPYRFSGGFANFVNFLPPAIIAGSACGMLLFANDLLWPYAFAAAFTIASKILIRAPMGNGAWSHAFNPSNLGIVTTLIVFPWIGLAPPYHFTNRIDMGDGTWNLIVPALAMASGIFLHGLFTGRLPLVLSWIFGFMGQALIRSYLNGVPWFNLLVPMTGASFVIFTLYMIPDPATTPIDRGPQIAFGLSCAALYGILFHYHIVFGWFFSLIAVAGMRYLLLWARYLLLEREPRVD